MSNNISDERINGCGPEDLPDPRDDSDKIILNNKTIDMKDPPGISRSANGLGRTGS